MSRYGKIKNEWNRKDKKIKWIVSYSVGFVGKISDNQAVIKFVNGKAISEVNVSIVKKSTAACYVLPSRNYEKELIVK